MGWRGKRRSVRACYDGTVAPRGAGVAQLVEHLICNLSRGPVPLKTDNNALQVNPAIWIINLSDPQIEP